MLQELDAALAGVRERVVAAHQRFGFGNHASWSGDMETGRLEIVFADGTRWSARFHAVASLMESEGSLEWTWNHPDYPEEQKRSSNALREWDQERNLALLTKGMIQKGASLSMAWTALAAARQLSGSQLALAIDGSGLTLCLLLDDLQLVARPS